MALLPITAAGVEGPVMNSPKPRGGEEEGSVRNSAPANLETSSREATDFTPCARVHKEDREGRARSRLSVVVVGFYQNARIFRQNSVPTCKKLELFLKVTT